MIDITLFKQAGDEIRAVLEKHCERPVEEILVLKYITWLIEEAHTIAILEIKFGVELKH